MEEENGRSNVLTWILGGIAAIGIITAIYFGVKKNDLQREKGQLSSRVDSLATVKQQIQQELNQYTTRYEAEHKQAEELSSNLEETNSQLARREAELRRLQRQNSASQQNQRQYASQVTELNTQIAGLNSQRDSMQTELLAQTNTNQRLMTEAEGMRTENQQFRTKLEASETQNSVLRNALTADYFTVELRKPNNKVTAKAKKVHQVDVSMRVPNAFGEFMTGRKTVYLSLTDEQNNALPGAQEGMVTVKQAGADTPVRVHATQAVDFGSSGQPIKFSFTLPEGLKPGTYKAAVYADNAYLGTTGFTVRDSFLFF
ncbi:hypothetical protein GCM10023189_04030 [Nibrella saemangeumensis]|uniref:Uncharacterized protein n=1 Tax=Nibrella saemangeumensis TaxID=1084526 RepID=A0ABP8MAV5_9BACT